MFSIVNKEEKGTLSFLTAGIKPASKEGRFSHRLIPFDTYSFKSSGGNCVPQTPMISGWRFERTREICVCPYSRPGESMKSIQTKFITLIFKPGR